MQIRINEVLTSDLFLSSKVLYMFLFFSKEPNGLISNVKDLADKTKMGYHQTSLAVNQLKEEGFISVEVNGFKRKKYSIL